MKLLAFAASHRTESLNRKLCEIAAHHAKSHGFIPDLADYAEFDMPAYNDEISNTTGVPDIAQSFGKRAGEAAGILICTPEYNWSCPGSLKNILDWTSRMNPKPLTGKTALLMSATPSGRGGIIGLSHLKTILESMGVFVYPKVFPLSNAESAFDDDGLSAAKQQHLLISLLQDYSDFTKKLTR